MSHMDDSGVSVGHENLDAYGQVSPRTVAEAIAPAINANSQNWQILLHLLSRRTITQVEAHELYRVYRLASRVTDLKNLGVTITKTQRRDRTGVRYVEYSL